jgi:hypothetical protein
VPLTAVLADAGGLDATMPGPAAEAAWAGVYRVRPVPLLTCPDCAGAVIAKMSRRGLRFFAHRARPASCAPGGETIAHHLLKAELATAARAAGWAGELEMSGDGWRGPLPG